MNTSKLFHTVVVLGMGLAAGAACSSTTSPTTVADAGTSGSSGATSGGTSGATSGGVDSGSSGAVDSGGTSGKVGDAGGDAFAGWFCCG